MQARVKVSLVLEVAKGRNVSRRQLPPQQRQQRRLDGSVCGGPGCVLGSSSQLQRRSSSAHAQVLRAAAGTRAGSLAAAGPRAGSLTAASTRASSLAAAGTHAAHLLVGSIAVHCRQLPLHRLLHAAPVLGLSRDDLHPAQSQQGKPAFAQGVMALSNRRTAAASHGQHSSSGGNQR